MAPTARLLALVASAAALVASSSSKSEQSVPVTVEPTPTAPTQVTTTERKTRPTQVKAADDQGRAIAQAVIDWCGDNGKAGFWRGDLTVEVVDIGKGRANVIVEHDRKDELLNGHTLWYLVTTKRGVPTTITPSKAISATACRSLSPDPLEADVTYALPKPDRLQAARDGYIETQREGFAAADMPFTVSATGTDYVVEIVGPGSCSTELLAKIEEVSRPHLARVGFKRVVCDDGAGVLPVW